MGHNINQSMKNIQNHWSRMQYYKPNDSKSLTLYATFCKDVLSNRKTGKILEKIKELEESKKKINDIEFDFNNKDEMFINAIIYCSAEQVCIFMIMYFSIILEILSNQAQ